jgi:hypothetical protein
MCRSRIDALRPAAAIVALGLLLAACSDVYFDRRETIALGADDAVATNKVTQMFDPWPRESGNRSVARNGDQVAGAIERYRTNRVIKPVGMSTSSTNYNQDAGSGAPATASAGTSPAPK